MIGYSLPARMQRIAPAADSKERCLPASGTALDALIDRLGTRGCCLTFHRVARREDWASMADQGFTLPLDWLDGLIARLLRRGWDIVTMDEALRRRPGDRRFINLSIDDAYRDTWELAVPLFRAHGVPATIYVTTGIPDGGYEMWRIGLETILTERDEVVSRDGATRIKLAGLRAKRAAFRRLCREWERVEPAAQYRAFCSANGYDSAVLHERHGISWDMLRSLSGDPCVEIGAHTVTHRRLSGLSLDAALAEMTGSRARLEAELGTPVRHFAFPYGRHGDCGPREFELARQAGFASAATTRKGLIRPGSNGSHYSLPRNTLNGMRGDGATLASHLTGVSGALARALGRN